MTIRHKRIVIPAAFMPESGNLRLEDSRPSAAGQAKNMRE